MRIYKSFFRFEKCRKACKYRLYRLMRTYKEIVKNYILIYAKYPETNQFAFENEIEIESRPLLKEVRNSLIKWGVIIKRPRIQSISIGRRKGTLYYLNRMFSPIFGISFRTRGGYNFVMPTALFESLLKESWEPEKIKNWKEKTQKTPTSLALKVSAARTASIRIKCQVEV